MNMDHKDFLKGQTEQIPTQKWEFEDVLMNNQALRLQVQVLTAQNEKLIERVRDLEIEISQIKREAMKRFENNGWGKGKDE
jgi:glutamate mutase epsilon subunit